MLDKGLAGLVNLFIFRVRDCFGRNARDTNHDRDTNDQSHNRYDGVQR